MCVPLLVFVRDATRRPPAAPLLLEMMSASWASPAFSGVRWPFDAQCTHTHAHTRAGSATTTWRRPARCAPRAPLSRDAWLRVHNACVCVHRPHSARWARAFLAAIDQEAQGGVAICAPNHTQTKHHPRHAEQKHKKNPPKGALYDRFTGYTGSSKGSYSSDSAATPFYCRCSVRAR